MDIDTCQLELQRPAENNLIKQLQIVEHFPILDTLNFQYNKDANLFGHL